MEVVLALDVGSTRVKAAYVAADGQVVEVARLPSPLGRHGCAPADLWLTVRRTAARLLARNRHTVRAVSITGATRCHVLLDAADEPLGNIVPPAYASSPAEAEQVAAAYDADRPADGPQASVYHPFARLLALEARHPDLKGRLHRMMELRDWLNFKLTGAARSDTVCFARLAPAERLQPTWVDVAVVLARLDHAQGLLAEPASPCAWLGEMRNRELPWSAISGVPVVVGSHDAWCASVGLGAVVNGHRYIESGRNETVALVYETPLEAPGLLTVPWGDGLFQVGGPTRCGAGTLAWVASKVLDVDPPAEVVKLAAQGRASSELPIFLPYVRGERTPLWRRSLPHGLYDRHATDSMGDVALAALVGIACANRYLLDRIPFVPSPIWVGGGMAAHDLWCQVKADVIGAPIRRVAERHLAAVGAALVAWTALGVHPTLAAAQREAVRIDRLFDPVHDGRYEPLYRRFVERLEGELRSGEFLRPDLERELPPDFYPELHEQVG